MTSTTDNNSFIQVFLLDDDSIFRLGIFTALEDEKYSDIQILAQSEIAALADLFAQQIPDLLILSIDLIRYPERLNSTEILCKQLNKKYPNLIIFLLTPFGTNKTIEKISGVKGCTPKDIDIDELAEALRICGKNGTYFKQKKSTIKKEEKVGNWLYDQCRFGLNKINQEVENIDDYLSNSNLSIWNLLFWQGRKRELKTARWLIFQLMPSNDYNYYSSLEENISSQENNLQPSFSNVSASLSVGLYNQQKLENAFDLTLAKIKNSVKNCTDSILEIDILKKDKKQELLVIIINQLQRILGELRIIDFAKNELPERKIIMLKDLWQSSTINFITRYYSQNNSQDNKYNLLELIWEESPLIEKESLSKIPFVEEIFAYWLFEEDIIIDNQIYKYNTENVQEIEELLLQNLILYISNIIMEFVLNNFSDLPLIRSNLYDLEWRSSRSIALFRNNLTWKYRQEKFWKTPKHIFEDQYHLLRLDHKGIIKKKITHPRHEELSSLKGLPLLVTMSIELRDGLTKILKEIGDIIGRVLVYLLTEIIGKAIGLIGKGILQGIGNKIRS